jgi:hypothetical protein
MWMRWNQTTHIFEKSDNNGSSWVPLALDASIITEGALAKARHHAQTAFKDEALTLAAALTLTAGQLVFPATQNASGNANTLDDYEEASWTPVLGGAGGTSGQTYSVQSGRAIKVGKKVTAWFRCVFTAKGTITGQLQLQGLPYTIVSDSNYAPLGHASWADSVTGFTNLLVAGVNNTTTANFFYVGAAAVNVTSVVTGDIGNTTAINGVIEYEAAA